MVKPLNIEELNLKEQYGIDQFQTVSSGIIYEPEEEKGMLYQFKLAWIADSAKYFNYDVALVLLMSLAISTGLPIVSKESLPELLEMHNDILKENRNDI